MEFNILGPTAVRADGQAVRLGPTNRRALLSLMIVEANRSVSSDQMLDALGQREEPRPTGAVLRSHIAQLRKVLGTGRLQTVAGGYLLAVDEYEIDAARFQAELKRAQAAMDAGDPLEAALELEQGLARWHGPALMDAGDAAWSTAESHRLNELHLVAEETLLDVRLALGEHEQVIELAQAAIAEDPQRESVWACLMLALYRTGRIAEAVQAYQRLRSVLLVPSGRAPSAELVNLERAILLRDPSLQNTQRPKVLTPTTMRMKSGRGLPDGVVTFLMTDVVGSTRLWETAPTAMRVALARHDELMNNAVESHDGVLLRERGEGDSTFSVFRRATDAAASALAAQLAFSHEPWPPGCVIHVRMAIHTGEASERDGDYYGRPVNRVARLRAIATGDQILVGQSAAEILLDHLPGEASLTALGVKELRDFDRPETVYVLGFDASISDAQGVVDEAATLTLSAADAGLDAGETPTLASAGAPAETAVASEPSTSTVAAGAEAPTSWQAVVEADLTYFEHTGDKDVAFPLDCDARMIPLAADTIMIGRPSSSHDIEPHINLFGPFEDPGVSRAHAVLERQPDGSYSLVDSGSTNGTFLNNMDYPITRRVHIPLSSGDCIYVGLWTKIEICGQ